MTDGDDGSWEARGIIRVLHLVMAERWLVAHPGSDDEDLAEAMGWGLGDAVDVVSELLSMGRLEEMG